MPDTLFDESAPAAGGEAVVGADRVEVVGLDVAIKRTGIAVPAAGTAGVGLTILLEESKRTAKLAELERIQIARDSIMREVRPHFVSGRVLIVIEGLAYASPSPYAMMRAGLYWILRDQFDRTAHVRVAVVAPKTRPVFATGNGNSDKAAVMREVSRRYPAFKGREDEADALVLRAMGMHWLGRPICALPKTHTRALASVAWPRLWSQPLDQ